MLTEQLNDGSLRKVIVYSTEGGTDEFLSSAQVWRDLVTGFEEAEIDWEKMRIADGDTEITYYDPNIPVSATMQLSDNNPLILMMTPAKNDSGVDLDSLGYWDVRGLIKNVIATNDEAAAHFNQDRNYTNKSHEEHKELLTSWYSRNTSCLSDLAEDADAQTKVEAVITCLENGTEDLDLALEVLRSIDWDCDCEDEDIWEDSYDDDDDKEEENVATTFFEKFN